MRRPVAPLGLVAVALAAVSCGSDDPDSSAVPFEALPVALPYRAPTPRCAA